MSKLNNGMNTTPFNRSGGFRYGSGLDAAELCRSYALRIKREHSNASGCI